jgi:GAF domain-containing protein
MYLSDLILRQAMQPDSVENTLFNITRMVNMKAGGVRCSVTQVLNEDEGIVVTSNDDRNASGIPIDLNKYPEVLHVYREQKTIAIDDIARESRMRSIAENFQNIQFSAMVITPLFEAGKFFGVMSVRIPRSQPALTEDELRFVNLIGNIVSLVLTHQDSRIGARFWLKAS